MRTEAPRPNVVGANPKRKAMNKQEIVRRYNRLHNRDKKAVTSAALEYLQDQQGITVGRGTLHYWRETAEYKYQKETPEKILEAYQYAFETMQPEAAAQPI